MHWTAGWSPCYISRLVGPPPVMSVVSRQPVMKASTVFYFASVALTVSIGCLLLLNGSVGAGACFGIVAVLHIPGQPLTRSVPPSRLWLTFTILFTLSVVILACDFLRSVSACQGILRVIGHPAFVVALWLLLMWGLYLRWQWQRGAADG